MAENKGRQGGHGPGGPGARGGYQKPKDAKRTLLRLMKYISGKKWLLVIVFLCVIISSVASIAGTYLIRPVLNELVGGGSLGLGDEMMPMRDMLESGIDTIVCGETTEWTSISYVRDAAMLHKDKGMIILGHNRTEEAGMKHFPAFLQPLAGDIPVIFIPSGEPVYYH